jgi:uncharacterized membrane protein YjjP (DUF1212 family)
LLGAADCPRTLLLGAAKALIVPEREQSSDALEVLTQFGASMLRAGNTTIRTRELMELMAPKLGFDAIAVSLSLDSITTNARHSGQWTTMMRMLGPPGINAWRIGQLEHLAKAVEPTTAPGEIAAKLKDVDSAAPLYSRAQIAIAIGLASGSFAFLNGVGVPEIIAAATGGGVGQLLRWSLSHRQLNQYGVAALSAGVASGTYVLLAALAKSSGIEIVSHSTGFIASVLFLVPGFPLIAALFDLLQYQTVAALSRFAYGLMILLAVAFGLSFVIGVAGVEMSRQPSVELPYLLKLILRCIASFVAACGFAISFNSPRQTVLAAGVLALVANDMLLVLVDAGMMLAPAAFLAALMIGVIALVLNRQVNIPPMATTVAPIVIMIPGLYAFQMFALFNQGRVLEALQASALLSFVVGALAIGLATARLLVRS